MSFIVEVKSKYGEKQAECEEKVALMDHMLHLKLEEGQTSKEKIEIGVGQRILPALKARLGEHHKDVQALQTFSISGEIR